MKRISRKSPVGKGRSSSESDSEELSRVILPALDFVPKRKLSVGSPSKVGGLSRIQTILPAIKVDPPRITGGTSFLTEIDHDDSVNSASSVSTLMGSPHLYSPSKISNTIKNVVRYPNREKYVEKKSNKFPVILKKLSFSSVSSNTSADVISKSQEVFTLHKIIEVAFFYINLYRKLKQYNG